MNAGGARLPVRIDFKGTSTCRNTSWSPISRRKDRAPALVVDRHVFDIAAATGRAAYATMLDVLRDWATARRLLADTPPAQSAGKSDGRPLAAPSC